MSCQFCASKLFNISCQVHSGLSHRAGILIKKRKWFKIPAAQDHLCTVSHGVFVLGAPFSLILWDVATERLLLPFLSHIAFPREWAGEKGNEAFTGRDV